MSQDIARDKRAASHSALPGALRGALRARLLSRLLSRDNRSLTNSSVFPGFPGLPFAERLACDAPGPLPQERPAPAAACPGPRPAMVLKFERDQV